MMQKKLKMFETLSHGYSSQSTQRELINECQHDRVKKVFKNVCILVIWTLECEDLDESSLSIGRVRLIMSMIAQSILMRVRAWL